MYVVCVSELNTNFTMTTCVAVFLTWLSDEIKLNFLEKVYKGFPISYVNLKKPRAAIFCYP